MSNSEQGQATAQGKIIAKAWRDPVFKAKLMANPRAAIEEAGVPVPPGVTVKVFENTATVFHLVLPPAPPRELSDENLDKVAGGHGWGHEI